MQFNTKILAAAVAGSLLVSAPAFAVLTVEEAGICSAKGVSKAISGFVASKVKTVAKAVTSIENKCLILAAGPERDECVDSKVKKLGSKIAKMEAKKYNQIRKGCADPVSGAFADLLNDPDFLSNAGGDNQLAYINEQADCLGEGVDLVAGKVDGDPTPTICTNKATAGQTGCAANTDCDSKPGKLDGVCASAGDGEVWAVCIDRRIERKVEDIVKEMHPRAWVLLSTATDPETSTPVIPDILQYLPIGRHLVDGTTNADLVTAGPTISLGPIPTAYELDIGAVDGDGVAEISIPQNTVAFDGVLIGAFGIFVCVDQLGNGAGSLCCDPAGCPTLGKVDYDTCQNHDNSGLNSVDPDGPGTVPTLPLSTVLCPGKALDPSCIDFSLNTVANLPTTADTACSEDKPRNGACNDAAIGGANPMSHFPRCTGGTQTANFACDDDVAAASTCGAGALSCASRLAAGANYTCGAPPCHLCNGPVTVSDGVDGFAEGDLAVAQTIQFTLHNILLDGVDYTATLGCVNDNADMIPDGYGCDGVPCTDDDTTPPADPTAIAFSTGDSTATIYDSNGLPVAAGGILSGGTAGVNPGAGACADLSVSVTAGYTVAGSFPALDNFSFGDSFTIVNTDW